MIPFSLGFSEAGCTLRGSLKELLSSRCCSICTLTQRKKRISWTEMSSYKILRQTTSDQ